MGLVMMNSFTFTLSGKHFICPSILNDSFAGQSNLGCRSLLFISLNISCQSFLACKVSFEKSADSLMGTPLQVTFYFSLAALFGILCASWTCMSMSFTKIGKFSSIIFSNKFSISHSSSSPSGIPVIQMLALLEMSQNLLILSSFFKKIFLFLHSVLVDCLFLPYVPNH